MNKRNTRLTLTLAALFVSILLTACGSSGGGSSLPTTLPDNVVPHPDAPPVIEPHPYDAPPVSDEDKEAFLKATNDARAVEQDCGSEGIFPPVAPLKWSDALYSAAYEHSEDMATVGLTSEDFDHQGSGTESDWTAEVQELGEGSTPQQRTDNNGFKGSTGENIHGSPDSIETAMEDWLESDHHCSNLMDPAYTHLGLAVFENEEARWRWYWTQSLGVGE